LGPGAWGLTARPNFTGTFLALYQEGQELAAAGKVIESAERWRVLAARLSVLPLRGYQPGYSSMPLTR